MPTYEYKCTECGYRFEVFQPISDDPIKKCEKCGGAVKRLIAAGTGLIFKGSGFYQTDYRSESYKKAAEREKPATGGSGEGEGSKPGKGASDTGSGRCRSDRQQSNSRFK